VPARATSCERAHSLARALAWCALGVLSSLWAGRVQAAPSLSHDIAPQPLAGALAEFARQTGLQLIYVSRLARGRASNGAHAGLATAEALPALLAGTGLGYAFLNERTVRIFEAAAPAVAPPPSQSRSAGVPRPGEDDEEIIVLGYRGADDPLILQEVQSAPASVSILSGDSLEAQKLEQLSDYAAYLPGVTVAGYGSPGAASIQFRGISTFTGAASGSYYLDDAPLGLSGNNGDAGSQALDIMPYDLERLEVRRGPQGTHYGADSASGLIRFVLKAPSFTGFEARVGADGSSVQGAAKAGGSIRAMLNTPIIPETLAMRVSGYDSYTPGYIDNAYNGARDVNPVRQTGVRAALLWRPAASLSVKVAAFWPRIHSDSEADVSSTGAAFVPGMGDANIFRPTGSYGDLTDNHAFLQPFKKSIDYYAASVHWAAQPVEIDSATAWSRTQSNSVFDQTLDVGASFPQWSNGAVAAGLAAFHQDVAVDKFSEELRIVSLKGRRFDWLLGGFYTHESDEEHWALQAFDYNYQPIAAFAPAASLTSVNFTFTQLASFGELTWHATERVDVTGGLRYAHSDQQVEALDSGTTDFPLRTEGGYSGGATTWLAAISYRVAPELMLYGRVATGSQVGGSNGVFPDTPPTVKPETIENYEAGLKSEFLDHSVVADLTLYYIYLKDIQLGNFFGVTWGAISGANAVSKGMELTTAYSPFGGLRLALGAAYIQSELTSYASGDNWHTYLIGYQLPDVPRWSYSVTADYDWALGALWHAHVGTAFRWVGARWGETGVRSVSQGGAPTMEVPAYSLLDLNASAAKGPIVLRVFARNVLDARAISQAIFLGDPPAAAEQRILQPRTIGVGFDYRF
jgi:iron complex outermembrane receptor protein